MMHRNRQVSLSFLFLFFCVIVTAQYGTIYNLPDFENSIPISEIPDSEIQNYYSALPAGQSWVGKKCENWNNFFEPNESVEVKLYYQKDDDSSLINETLAPTFKTEPWFAKVQFMGFTYVVLDGKNCQVVLKYWRSHYTICQYQSYVCNSVNVNVDFEPDLNLIQTIPYHLEKENSNLAFISAQLEKNTAEWKLKFWSSEVEILDFVELDNYYSNFDSYFSNDTLIVSFPNVAEIENELTTHEQLISVLNIQL